MKSLFFFFLLLVCASVIVTAESLNPDGDGSDNYTLKDFSGGQPAYASEVNANFDKIVINGVNDNDARIDSLENGVPKQSTGPAGAAVSPPSSYTTITSVTLNAPSSGYALVLADGMIQLSGKTTGGYASVYVGVADNTTSPSANDYTRLYLSTDVTGSYEMPFSAHSIFPVTSGDNTFYLLARDNGTSGSGRIWFSRISAVFIKN